MRSRRLSLGCHAGATHSEKRYLLDTRLRMGGTNQAIISIMKQLNAIGWCVIGSILTGLAAGFAWILGNKAADAGTLQLVLLAIPSNLVAALLFYFVVRGSVASADGGLGLFFAVAVVNLFVTLGVATSVAGVLGTGAGKIGAHVFSWGMSYAYGQAFRDVKSGIWFDE